jgi:hypothetical protein
LLGMGIGVGIVELILWPGIAGGAHVGRVIDGLPQASEPAAMEEEEEAAEDAN